MLQYAVRGEIPFAYGVWMGSIGLVGGFIGRKVALFVARNMKKPSITIFCLAGVLYCGLGLLIYTMAEDGVQMDVESFCGIL